MTELNAELKRAVESPSLPQLIQACGVIVADNSNAVDVDASVAVTQQLLAKANSEGVFLSNQPSWPAFEHQRSSAS